jgi:hypothetical protein
MKILANLLANVAVRPEKKKEREREKGKKRKKEKYLLNTLRLRLT